MKKLLFILFFLPLFADAQERKKKPRKSITVSVVEKQIKGYEYLKDGKVRKNEWVKKDGTKYIVEHRYDSLSLAGYTVKVWKLVKAYPNTWRKQKVGQTFRLNTETRRSEQLTTNLEFVEMALKSKQ